MRKAKIVGIKHIGLKSCMDIEVDSHQHVFYGNNMVVSNSHSVSYAVCSYWSAYEKAHNPLQFFLSYLYFANEKQDPHREIYELISEAKLFDIQIKTPSLKYFSDKFSIKNKDIYFGIKDIKSLTGKTGDNVISSIRESEDLLNKKIYEFSWLEILLFFSDKVSSTAFKALSSVGFFRDCASNINRNKALYEYDIFKNLTKAELSWAKENYKLKKWNNLIECLKDVAPTKKQGGGTSREDRKQIIENEIQLLVHPPYELIDDPNWIVEQEIKFFGCPVSLSKVETSDTSAANTTCKEIVNGKKGKNLCVVANVQRVSDYKITKGESIGQTMSFLTIEDDSCMLDSVIVFPKVKEKYKYILYEGNNLIFCGSVSENDSSFIINTIHEI